MTANEFFRRHPHLDDHGRGRETIKEALPKIGWHATTNFRMVKAVARRHGFTAREADAIAYSLLDLVS